VRLAMVCRQRGTVDADALDAFIDRFGHRGVNELDPTAPVWANQRCHLADIVTRMAAASIDESVTTMGSQVRMAAEASLTGRPRLQRARVTQSLRLARRLAVAGERSKGAVARYVHELRRALNELRTRLPKSLADDDVVLLSWPELQAVALTGTPSPGVDVDSRRRELSAVNAAETNPGPSSSDTIVLHGIGASMGTATGRATVVNDPLGPLPFGDILVAHATDTAWTPLFIGMRAVVTDTGQLMSHSSIVARDLGIPAVVGTGRATSLIATGDHTDVDGDRGIVTVTRTS
jgi:phosphohistidine swiveling domain-containing protein